MFPCEDNVSQIRFHELHLTMKNVSILYFHFSDHINVQNYSTFTNSTLKGSFTEQD